MKRLKIPVCHKHILTLKNLKGVEFGTLDSTICLGATLTTQNPKWRLLSKTNFLGVVCCEHLH